jgi:tRNA dimethylallyltransferase
LRQHRKTPRNFSVIKIGLDVERSMLYRQINQRVDEMMHAGLLEEVKTVIRFRDANPLQTVGYKELFAYLDGKISLHDAVELIKRNTRRYAKRQLTWFRKDKEIVWFDPEKKKEIIAHIEKLMSVRF